MALAAPAIPHHLHLLSRSLHSIPTSPSTAKWPSSCTFSVKTFACSQTQRLGSMSGVVTDQNVPEGHKGLHGFLYADGEEHAHSAGVQGFSGRIGEDDGGLIIGWDDYILPRDGIRFAGVFAIYAQTGELQYIGYSRNVICSLKSHRSTIGGEKCSAVRVRVFSDVAMISKTRLEEEQQQWLTSMATLPPGNSTESSLWIETRVSMSEEERSDYEEKKLKMRKAMGENLADEVDGEDDGARTRRLNLLKAVEGDDWSGVIDAQSKKTLESAPEKVASISDATIANQEQYPEKIEPEEAQSSQIVSPFDKPASQRSEGLYSAQSFEFTLENVDLVLDEVRPYLISDGGNVEVVSASDGVVSLRLQGACGACPSSTSTMKMGIERVLKEKFGEAVKEVVQIDAQTVQATVMGINAHLEMLRPAIHNYGGTVEVVSVDIGSGRCDVKFKGPAPLGTGIQAAIKDKFPDIMEVILVDP